MLSRKLHPKPPVFRRLPIYPTIPSWSSEVRAVDLPNPVTTKPDGSEHSPVVAVGRAAQEVLVDLEASADSAATQREQRSACPPAWA
jgi:hypothetical protein